MVCFYDEILPPGATQACLLFNMIMQLLMVTLFLSGATLANQKQSVWIVVGPH